MFSKNVGFNIAPHVFLFESSEIHCWKIPIQLESVMEKLVIDFYRSKSNERERGFLLCLH